MREHFAQTVQFARIRAREPHRVRTARAVGQYEFFDEQHKVVAGLRIVDVHRPADRAVGAGFRFFARKHRVQYRRWLAGVLRRDFANITDAVTHDFGQNRTRAGRGHGAVAQFNRVLLLARCFCQRVEFHIQPCGVLATHVHRQGFGQCAQTARVIAIDPAFKRLGVVVQMADEYGKVARRVLHHVCP